MALALRQRTIMKRSLVCPICQNFFRKATTIEDCCHQFCEKCITKKITEEGLHHCPVCNVDLGSAPLQRLRCEARMHALNTADYRWQKTLDEFNKNETKRENRESGSSFVTAKSPNQEIYGFDANSHTTEASSRTANENKKHDVDSLTSEKKRGGTWTPENETRWAESYSKHESRDLRARRREEKYSNINTTNSTQIAADVECNEKKVDTFWFSLVASDNQRCKAPLEQIPSKYLRVKDGNITVASIKKYLMQKLKLRSENEVEIFLQGRPLLPSVQICKLVDMWLHTTTPLQKKKAFVGSSASDFVLTLTYSRRPMSA